MYGIFCIEHIFQKDEDEWICENWPLCSEDDDDDDEEDDDDDDY